MTVLLIAAGLLGGCANNHPIDESKLPDLESQQQQQQETQMQEQQGQEQQSQSGSGTSDIAGEGSPSGDSSSASEALISESEAIGIALAKVPGASEHDIVSLEKDYDYNRWIYEGEISYEGLEYDFEIDAQTGNILEWEIDD